MSVLAIIAEYNPYTKGHDYLLQEAKRITGADTAVSVMGGNFLQRGIPAMWNKYTRAEAAVRAGLDCVIELPFAYATGSALDFAQGAVSLLNALSCVDFLCFGAETEDTDTLLKISDFLTYEPADYQSKLKEALSSGLSFPAAREEALFFCGKLADRTKLHELLSSPNNILAIEYLTAIKRTGSALRPVMIKRAGSDYKSTETNAALASATAVRAEYIKCKNSSGIKAMIPEPVFDVLKSADQKSAPITEDLLTPFLQQALLLQPDISEIYGISEATANKLKNISGAKTYDELRALLHTREITESAVSRGLIHLILQYNKEDRILLQSAGDALYANILALRENASSLIKEAGKTSSIPVINLKKHAERILSSCAHSDAALLSWQLDTRATALYNCLVKNRFQTELPTDLTVKYPVV